MKKIALFMAIAIAAIACNKTEESVVPEIKVITDQATLLVPNGEGEVEFVIETNVDWTAEFKDAGYADWCSFTPAEGEKGTSTIKVMLQANATGADRVATIVITAGTAQESVNVTQGNRLEVTPAEDQWLPIEGGSVQVTVVGNIECNVTATENEWLTMTSENGVYTFTAGANDAYDYRSVVVTVTPKDAAYADMAKAINIFQSGKATKLWTLNPTLDLEGYDASKTARLAAYGDYILLANTTKVYAINPADGSVVTTYNMPEGVEASSLCVDDAGNIVIMSDNVAYGGTIGVYTIADPNDPASATQIAEWSTVNYYGADYGNLRVRGNVKEEAIAVFLIGGTNVGVALEIKNSSCDFFYWINTDCSIDSSDYGCLIPLGGKFTDGFMFTSYNYGYVSYNVSPVDSYTDNTWTKGYATGYSWMENVNCLTIAEYNGKKYAAFTAGCHFNYDSADAVLIDITDPAAPQHVYSYLGDLDVARDEAFANLDWTGQGTYSDILLVPTADALLMVYVDSNFNGMSCIAIQQ